MTFLQNNLLTLLIFLPTAGAILTLINKNRQAVRWTALATTLVTLCLCFVLLLTFKWKADPDYRPPNLGQAGRTDVSFIVARDLDDMDMVAATPTIPIEEA